MSLIPLLHPPDPLPDYRAVARFLRLGTEAGAYDVAAPDRGPTPALDAWLAADGPRVVRDAAASLADPFGRPGPALHVLARAIAHGPAAARRAALAALPAIPDGPLLLRLLGAVSALTPWSPALRAAVGSWYAGRATADLAPLVLAPPAPGGFGHRDALLLARPQAPSPSHMAIFRWLVEGRQIRRSSQDAGLDLVAHHARLLETTSPLVARSILERRPALRAALPARWARDPELAAWLAARDTGADLLGWVPALAATGSLGADGLAAQALAARLAAEPEALVGVRPEAILAAWAAVRFQAACGQAPPKWLADTLYARFHERLAAEPRGAGALVVAIDPAASTALDGLPACPGLAPRTALAALALLAVARAGRAEVLAYGRDLEPVALARGDELDALLGRLDRVRAGRVDGAAPLARVAAVDPAGTTVLALAGTRPAPWAQDVDALLARRGGDLRWIGVGVGPHRLVPRPPASFDALAIHGWDATVPALVAAEPRT